MKIAENLHNEQKWNIAKMPQQMGQNLANRAVGQERRRLFNQIVIATFHFLKIGRKWVTVRQRHLWSNDGTTYYFSAFK